jgi:hypothetical protein
LNFLESDPVKVTATEAIIVQKEYDVLSCKHRVRDEDLIAGLNGS